MKVCYLGDFSETWHTESDIARDFEALGHTVQRGGRYLGIPNTPEADLVLLQANGGIKGDARPWLRQVERQGIPTASWHLDLFVGLARQSRIGLEALWQTQVVFTPDGDPNSRRFFASRNIDHRWLPAAVASDQTHAGTWQARYDHDIVFVGSQNYHPEHPWRRELLHHLQHQYGDRFKVYDHHPPTRGQDLNDLYATARVVVGDSLCLPGSVNYSSDRIFETLGRGGALVFPKVPGIEDLGFQEHEHLRFYDYGDTEGLTATIDDMLAHPDETRLMAKRGQQFVAENHTYRHRIQHLLLELDLA